MKKSPSKKATVAIEVLAKAEKILNRTLAYQAAIAVHELKEALGLDVKELCLVVAPLSPGAPGAYRVTCTIANLAASDPLVLDTVVEPDKAVTSGGALK